MKMQICRLLSVAVFVLGLATINVSAQTYSDLYDFATASGDPLYPQNSGIVAQGRDGNLYSTTASGGTGYGTVFKITPGGQLTVLYNFDSTHGASPFGGLTLGTDGNFYGTATYGGSAGYGTVFKITPAGALTVLHNFTYTDGYAPYAPPIQGADGNFYGTTLSGGAVGYGTVYKMTPTGNLTTLYSFDLHPVQPLRPPDQGPTGTSTAQRTPGGVGYGTVFKVTTKGTLTHALPVRLHPWCLHLCPTDSRG